MKKLITLCLMLLAFSSYGQKLNVNIVSADLTSESVRLLKARISGGSGKYLVLWNTDKGSFNTERNDPYVLVPLSKEDITYTVFVRDSLSGELIVKSINMNTNKPDISIYPNPASENLIVDFKTLNSEALPEVVNIVSENSIAPLISLEVNKALTGKNDGKVSINVKDFKKGIYYLHLLDKEGKRLDSIRLILGN